MATEKAGASIADFKGGMFALDGASENKKVLLYGDSGVGKTVFSGMLPGRLLFLAGEPGYISAARMGSMGSVRVLSDTAMAVAGVAALSQGLAKEFDWVILDGLSTLNNRWLLQYTAEAFDRNPTSRAHRNLPDKPDYLNAQNFTKSFVASLVDLPCNVLITAHAMYPENAQGETRVLPDIQGKKGEISNFVCGLMHVIGYMRMASVTEGKREREVRRVLFNRYVDPESGTQYLAKDQFQRLPRVATVRDPENPDGWTLSDLMALTDATVSTTDTQKRKKGKRA